VSDGYVTATNGQRADRKASSPVEVRLRGLASTGGKSSSSALDAPPHAVLPSGLDDRTDALVRLAALLAMGGSATSYGCTVDLALDGGATEEEILGTLLAVAPTVGLSRLVPATVGLALALGYDIDAALECFGPPADIGEPSRYRR
jgi:alkylhydroperoxidase/carboxymuconolactone decarboxylase family protein YurZ